MLVLGRKPGERIFIGKDICVTIVKAEEGWVKVGIDAPSSLTVLREELAIKDQAARRDALVDTRSQTEDTTVRNGLGN